MRGESLARKYLCRSGYRIIDRNYRLGRQEIDLIARLKNRVVFIEVKTRIKTADSQRENPLTPRQNKGLKKAIAAYCLKNRFNLDLIRFDLIIILVDRHWINATLKHYRDIF